jgi:hypothetical protein
MLSASFIIILLISVTSLAVGFLFFLLKLEKSYKNISTLYEQQIEKLNEWHDSTRFSAAKSTLSEACLIKALEEIDTNQNGKGMVYAKRWLEKRTEMLEELQQESEALGHRNLDEVYDSSLRISLMIYSGELDIKRD